MGGFVTLMEAIQHQSELDGGSLGLEAILAGSDLKIEEPVMISNGQPNKCCTTVWCGCARAPWIHRQDVIGSSSRTNMRGKVL